MMREVWQTTPEIHATSKKLAGEVISHATFLCKKANWQGSETGALGGGQNDYDMGYMVVALEHNAIVEYEMISANCSIGATSRCRKESRQMILSFR